MKEISAEEAYKMMSSAAGSIYLDVRSVPEFEQGHPQGAINIPILNFVPGMGMLPNRDFSAVVEATLAKDAQIIVGCKTGGRSAQACQVMESVGFTNVANVRSGFVGAMDNMGRIVEPGWSLLNLPICKGCEEDSRYEFIAARAKK